MSKSEPHSCAQPGDDLDEQPFYELMQRYRHVSNHGSASIDQGPVVEAFEAVKSFIRAQRIARDGDWELQQFDHEHGSTFTRRLAVPGGWIYQTREASQEGWVIAPVFVPAPIEVGRDASVDHGAARLPEVEILPPNQNRKTIAVSPTERPRMIMLATVASLPINGRRVISVGDVVAVEVPPNCTVHSADAAGLARVLECARIVGEHWRNQDGIYARYLDELGKATAFYFGDAPTTVCGRSPASYPTCAREKGHPPPCSSSPNHADGEEIKQ